MTVSAALADWSHRSGPLHRRLADALRSAIERGDLPPGTRLPAERALARMLAVSRSTVVAAYAALRRESLLESRRGSGTYVRRPPTRRGALLPAGQQAGRGLGIAALCETGKGAVELTAAAVPGNDVLRPEDVAAALADPEVATGNGYSPFGLSSLRRAVARRLTEDGLPTGEEQVLVTSGAQQAIGLVASLLAGRGDHAAIETPTYPGAIDILAGLGVRMLPVPVDERGVRADLLRELALEHAPRLAYLVPTFHNPTGTVLSDERRREVAQLSLELGLPVVDDRSTAELALEGTPVPPPLAAYEPEAPVLTVGSMSKLYWGGLRIGWVRAAEPLVARLSRLKVVADLGSSAVSQASAVRLLARAEEVRALRARQLSASTAVLRELLETLLPDWSWTMPRGGSSLWVRLPRGDAEELAQLALRRGVAVVPGTVASSEREHRDCLRLPLQREPEVLEEGIRRLAAAWRAYEPAAEPHRGQLVSVVV